MKTFSLILFSLVLSLQVAEARRRSAPPTAGSLKEEEYLSAQIKATGLDAKLPVELEKACEGQDKNKVWTQLMTGLAYIESKWNSNDNNASDANGTPSTGLYQMTGPGKGNQSGDIAGGKACFKSHAETKDAQKNISCAVKKMKDLMAKNNSLKKDASRYWGPFGAKQWRKKGKGGSVVAMVAASCQGKSGSLDDYNGEGKGLASNNKEYWEQVESYTPYEMNERAPASGRRATRQASR